MSLLESAVLFCEKSKRRKKKDRKKTERESKKREYLFTKRLLVSCESFDVRSGRKVDEILFTKVRAVGDDRSMAIYSSV